MKQNDNNTFIVQISLCIAICIIGFFVVNSIKSKVSYLDVPCPHCGSTEVMDYGINDNNEQHGKCFDCNTEFYILK